VVRYDTAHGYAHIDRLNLKRKRKKERLQLNFSEALTRAERDIKEKLVDVSGKVFEWRVPMTKKAKELTAKNLDLIFEFEKYILEHPDFGEQISRNSIVSMRVEGDKVFNRWSQELAETQLKKKKRPIVLVTIRRMRPAMSRIEELKIEQAA
jgi:hypothetical protein